MSLGNNDSNNAKLERVAGSSLMVAFDTRNHLLEGSALLVRAWRE
jgi:hypothetical protein